MSSTTRPKLTPEATPRSEPTLRPVTILIDRARICLRDAAAADDPAERFRLAHLAALRTAAALLVLHTDPDSRSRRRPLRNVWTALASAEPALSGWANRFAAGAHHRAAIDAGIRHGVSAPLAAEWLHAAAQFLTLTDDLAAEAIVAAHAAHSTGASDQLRLAG